MPEHMNGDYYLAGERSVPHQLFSSAGVVVPAVRGLLGLETSEASGTEGGAMRVVSFRPQLPANWSFARFSGYAAGGDRVSGEVRQEAGRTVVRLHLDGAEPVSADVENDDVSCCSRKPDPFVTPVSVRAPSAATPDVTEPTATSNVSAETPAPIVLSVKAPRRSLPMT